MNRYLSLALGVSALGLGIASAQMTAVNGASFDSTRPMAPGSFASIFGQNLCGQTAAGNWVGPGQLPSSIAGCSVMVNGVTAMLHYVSGNQVNFIVPQNMGLGMASLAVNSGSAVQTGSMMIGPAGPGVFAMTGMGVGEGAMLHGTMWTRGPFSTSTNGQPTPVSIFMTGLDLSSKPVVSIGGVTVEVTWYGTAPGFAGLQQINIMMPAGVAGAGRVPVTVTSDGQTSNVTYMTVLPTTAMMQGMPGWGNGMMVAANMARGHELSYMDVNASNNTAVVADEDDDVVRVISLDSQATLATITLPEGSEARAVAVNPAGTLAAVALSAKASVALIDLSGNTVSSVIGTGSYPSHLAFSGASLLVTNSGSGTVSVIDTGAGSLAQTVNAGFGPGGIAVGNGIAVVANEEAGSLSIVKLADYSVSTVALPAGSRPHEVAIAAGLNKAIVSTPMSNGFLLVDLGTNTVTPVPTDVWNAMGPGAIVTNGAQAFIGNMMTASVTVIDLAAGKVVKTFPVDPGPHALAVNAAKNQLLVLAEGTGTLDVVDLGGYSITARVNAGGTERQGDWLLHTISSVSPNAGAAGSTLTVTIAGSNLQGVKSLGFALMGTHGGGMMGGGMSGMGANDPNIVVSQLQVNAAGTGITASVQILGSAVPGSRLVRIQGGQGPAMMSGAVFTVTK